MDINYLVGAPDFLRQTLVSVESHTHPDRIIAGDASNIGYFTQANGSMETNGLTIRLHLGETDYDFFLQPLELSLK